MSMNTPKTVPHTPLQVIDSYLDVPTYERNGKLSGTHKRETWLLCTDGKSNTGSGIAHVISSKQDAQRLAVCVNSHSRLVKALEVHQRDTECYCVNPGEGNRTGNPCAWCLGKDALATLQPPPDHE